MNTPIISKTNQMKLAYKTQMLISAAIIILANILTDLFQFWIYRSIGFGICGLIWIVHPVVPNRMEPTAQIIFWTRVGGFLLILIGVFTRVHYS